MFAPDGIGVIEPLIVHQGDGDIQLKVAKKNFVFLLVQNVGIDHTKVNEVVQNSPVPRPGLGLDPVKGEQLVTAVNPPPPPSPCCIP